MFQDVHYEQFKQCEQYEWWVVWVVWAVWVEWNCMRSINCMNSMISMSSMNIMSSMSSIKHCKLAALSRRQKPMLPGRWYLSISPTRQQSLQFYNEFIIYVKSSHQHRTWLNHKYFFLFHLKRNCQYFQMVDIELMLGENLWLHNWQEKHPRCQTCSPTFITFWNVFV